MNPLAGWENFYLIVGSSAGALIGLQFVVITLTLQLADQLGILAGRFKAPPAPAAAP